jgi:hypothetical protein
MMKQLTIADRILITVIVVAVLASFFAVARVGTHGATVFVEVNGKTVYKASLSEPRIITIAGARGELVVETRDGRVAVTHAECPNHICVRTGWRSRSGDVIVCVPNKTLVRVAGDMPEGVQAVTE